MQRILVAFAATLIGIAVAGGQSSPPANPVSTSPPPAKPELQDAKSNSGRATTPLLLKDVGPLSPEDAAKLAAKELAKANDPQATDKPAAKPKENKAQDQTKGAASSGAVMEFQPAGSSSRAASPAIVNDKKSHASRIHGDLYGAAGGTGHATSESAGGTSRSGKTSVYVQSDQARSNSNQAQ